MDILGWLQYFGITPDKVTPFVIFGIVAVVYFNKKLKAEISPTGKMVSSIKNAVIEIQTIFKSVDINLDHKLIETTGSPLMPTQIGKEFFDSSGLTKILDDNADFLRLELGKLLPENHTEYDVQEKARQLLIFLLDKPIMNPVKKYVYDNGMSENVLESYVRAAGLWLRDDFLNLERRTSNK